MKTNIKNLSVFICICTIITVLLAATNSLTEPIISRNQNASANQALLEVLPEGKGFETVDISAYTLPSTVSEIYKETSDNGYVIKLVTSGYGKDMVIMCGISTELSVTGAVCLSSNETLGYEKTYGESFVGKDVAGVEEVDTISGATKTTAAYKKAIKDAINTCLILGGTSLDVRTPEEILADNLALALPSAENSFEKMFRVEYIEDVDAIYTATNGSGYVFVSGEQFIGVLSDGTVLSNTDKASEFSDYVNKLKSLTFEDIDVNAYPDLLKNIVNAKIVSNGNFVIESKGAGYGIKGGNEYHPASNEYIIVRVALTPDGKIVDCLTVSEAETDGLGDACADESFYGQFVGKNETNYVEIDGISGATMTTDGYKQAIQRAFSALNTLNGGESNE